MTIRQANQERIEFAGDNDDVADGRLCTEIRPASNAERRPPELCLGSITQIPMGEGRVFLVSGEEVAVFRTRTGEVYATQAVCPHRAGPLSDGLLGGTTLVCPLHGWKFDLTTGRSVSSDCRLTTYPVHVTEAGEILLRRNGD